MCTGTPVRQNLSMLGGAVSILTISDCHHTMMPMSQGKWGLGHWEPGSKSCHVDRAGAHIAGLDECVRGYEFHL